MHSCPPLPPSRTETSAISLSAPLLGSFNEYPLPTIIHCHCRQQTEGLTRTRAGDEGLRAHPSGSKNASKEGYTSAIASFRKHKPNKSRERGDVCDCRGEATAHAKLTNDGRAERPSPSTAHPSFFYHNFTIQRCHHQRATDVAKLTWGEEEMAVVAVVAQAPEIVSGHTYYYRNHLKHGITRYRSQLPTDPRTRSG